MMGESHRIRNEELIFYFVVRLSFFGLRFKFTESLVISKAEDSAYLLNFTRIGEGSHNYNDVYRKKTSYPKRLKVK